MKETGIVVKIEDRTAVIEPALREGCAGCFSCRALGRRRITVSGEAAKDLRVGDRVEVEINISSMLGVYLLLYAVPLAVFVGALFAFYAISYSPAASFIGAVAATVLSYAVAGLYMRKSRRFSPDIYVRKSED